MTFFFQTNFHKISHENRILMKIINNSLLIWKILKFRKSYFFRKWKPKSTGSKGALQKILFCSAKSPKYYQSLQTLKKTFTFFCKLILVIFILLEMEYFKKFTFENAIFSLSANKNYPAYIDIFGKLWISI